jgi:hypothetical protein
MSREGIAGSYGSSVFKASILFFIMAAPIHIPTNSMLEFPFCTSSVFVIFCLFYHDHPNWYEVASYRMFM